MADKPEPKKVDWLADNWREQAAEASKERDKYAPPSRKSLHPLGAIMDALGYAQGGTVKKGSYTVPQMCKGGKVIKSWGK